MNLTQSSNSAVILTLATIFSPASATNLFIPENGSLNVNSEALVFGAAGREKVSIANTSYVQLDGNIEILELTEPLASYQFSVTGTIISIYRDNLVNAQFLGLNQPVQVTFSDGSATLALTGLNQAQLGTQSLSMNPQAIETPLDDPEDTIDASCPSATDETPISPGPYDHLLAVATSTDGLNFSGDQSVLLEHASAPDAVIGPNDKTWIYYVNGSPGQHAIFIAQVSDDGTVTPFNCVRINGQVDTQAVDPDVLRLSDGAYQLFFNPLVSASGSENEGIYYATSTDGIHFSSATQIIAQTGALNPSGIQLNDGSWLLTFTDESRTYIANSTDGESYEIIADFPPGIPELSYQSDNNEIRLYNAELTGLEVRVSIDNGLTWNELQATAPGVQDPSILKHSSSEWLLYYRFTD
ncbi:MAG: exo-alpha-sialidase [Pseudomonadales bacterium]|nr:exo-alpha-sialidase [Pseudomonadales bacterium]